MTDYTTSIRAALREFSGKPLRRYLAERQTAGPIPSDDGSISWTADHLVDDPREPIITPVGVLDHRGMMLVRVRIPIKVAMGFHKMWENQEPEEVEAIIPEDMLSISDIGAGVDHVPPEADDDDDEDGSTVNLSEVLSALGAQGIRVNVDVDFIDAGEVEVGADA
ncbi:hypothetical protein KABACHOK_00050 [Brevundimonas phage vB_BpoS-Kabachok]|uniref:Uncharacterized protein n=1 Tax=Brevundimonas phage vB_BpoS-Kabachok TaxID=2948600 RepID=A0A9E7SLJ2_9CAUD|nr:hypothetical protein KABACHOK_00050 [Brevundimonas phage vB_BpoS-Kabachok]